MGFESKKSIATELELFIDNDGPLYRSAVRPMLRSQCAKKAAGRWNKKRSITGWMHVVDAGAKKFTREENLPGPWHKVFPMAVRRQLAREYARDTARQCIEHGLKKRRKTKSKKRSR